MVLGDIPISKYFYPIGKLIGLLILNYNNRLKQYIAIWGLLYNKN